MLKNVIKRFFPDLEKIKEEKVLKILGPAILQPNLWHLNRKSVSRAIAIGLFCAFLPIPLQMVLAAFFAIIFAANLPISVILVWITNPITIPPILLIAYKIGALIIGPGDDVLSIGSDFDFISGTIKVWKPVLIGSLIMSVVSSFIGYLIVSIYWRLYVSSSWHNRKKIK